MHYVAHEAPPEIGDQRFSTGGAINGREAQKKNKKLIGHAVIGNKDLSMKIPQP